MIISRQLKTPDDLLPRISAGDTTVSAQEIFEAVCVHLSQQKAQSYSEDEDGCVYRSPDGLKCAVGCLIPDNLYSKGMENNSASVVITTFDLSALQNHKTLLDALQGVHDSFYGMGDSDETIWELENIAEQHSLDASFLSGMTFA